MTPWGQDPRSRAWFWEVSGKRKRSRLPPEYSPTHACGERPPPAQSIKIIGNETEKEARHYKAGDEDVNLTLAMYMLGFSSYLGFNEVK